MNPQKAVIAMPHVAAQDGAHARPHCSIHTPLAGLEQILTLTHIPRNSTQFGVKVTAFVRVPYPESFCYKQAQPLCGGARLW